MVVDTFCYVGNIIGEASTVPSVKKKLELVFALISIVMLVAFNTIFFLQVWDQVTSFVIQSIGIDIGDAGAAATVTSDAGGDGDDDDGVSGSIVLFFGFIGLVCDIISIHTFMA